MNNNVYRYLVSTFLFLMCINVSSSEEKWERIGTFDGVVSGLIQSLGAADNGYLFACISNGAPLYRSTDNGTTWKKTSMPKDNDIYSIATKDSIIFAASTKGIYRSCDYGTTCLAPDSVLKGGVKSLIILSNGTLCAGTYSNGIYRSIDNGATWIQSNTGLSSLKISALASTDSNFIVAATNGEGIYVSNNGGNSWKIQSTEVRLNYTHTLAVTKEGHIYAGTDNYGIFRSKDSSVSWDQMTSDISSKVYAIVISASNVIYAGTSQQGVYKTTDDGNSWQPDNNGIDEGTFTVYSMVITPSGEVFAGANGGAAYKKTFFVGVDEKDIYSETVFTSIIHTNEEFIISFKTEKSTEVKCVLYSVLGEKVSDLVNGHFSVGNHTFSISQRSSSQPSLPGGMYYCRFDTPHYSLTKSVLIEN